MGGCVSHDRDNQVHRQRRSYSSRSSATTSGNTRRNKPLNRSACNPKWKSDIPINETQLRRKREEYWDTAPAFEGRKEIWDALRGACYAIEQNDIDLAQSIINCANITLPHGTLLDCYDELGTRYQIPVYILSSPINLVDGEQSSVDSRADEDSGSNEIGLATIAAADRERDLPSHEYNQSFSSSSSTTNRDRINLKSTTEHNPIVREIKKHRRKQKSNTQSSVDSANDSFGHSPRTPPSPILNNTTQTSGDQETEIPIKFRLSNGNEHRLYCKPNDKIRTIKRRLAMLENGAIDSQTQRLFFGGKLLRDRTEIWETRLQRNFVVQVILTDNPSQPNGAITTTDHRPSSSNPIPIEVPHCSTYHDPH